jgi:ribosomal protein S12 methylthiotransferase
MKKKASRESGHRKAAIVTLGCPKNDVDSEVVAAELVRGGWRLTGDMRDADVVLVNTCGFIRPAREESLEAIRQVLAVKKNGRPQVIVWGCMVQRDGKELADMLPQVDAFYGVMPFEEIGRDILGPGYKWEKAAFSRRKPSMFPHSAYLKIADGCRHQCTFCTIPSIKGPFQSRAMEDLVAEAAALAEGGVRELILVAQDTSGYGMDLNDGSDLPNLLKHLCGIDLLRWIRVQYAHPAHLSDRILDVIKEEEKICRYLDLPLQHIADPLLRAMGRSTSRNQIERWIHKIRRRLPDITLRTTFIVGFPGETEEMFDELVDFVKAVRFERLGVFPFFPESGTPAAAMEPVVPDDVKEGRVRVLMETQQKIAYEANQRLIGRTVPVLVDGFDPGRGESFGRTEGDSIDIDQTVWIKGCIPAGEWSSVRIERCTPYDLIGRLG